MPAYRGIFVADPCEFTATLGSESVTFVFDRAKMTLRREREMKQALAVGDVDAMVKDLLGVLISWDVVDDENQPVPLTTDILLDLPARALGNLAEGISKAAQPSDAEGEVSSGPSSGSPPEVASTDSIKQQLESRQTLQNGAEPSSSPEPSASPSPT